MYPILLITYIRLNSVILGHLYSSTLFQIDLWQYVVRRIQILLVFTHIIQHTGISNRFWILKRSVCLNLEKTKIGGEIYCLWGYFFRNEYLTPCIRNCSYFHSIGYCHIIYLFFYAMKQRNIILVCAVTTVCNKWMTTKTMHLNEKIQTGQFDNTHCAI